MANPEHVALAQKGREAIAEWGEAHPGEHLDLSGAKLSGANLVRANLTRANLSQEMLIGVNLSGANLSQANLTKVYAFATNFNKANLSGADLIYANLSGANLSEANLRKADLSVADLILANLSEANLSEANLFAANLSRANLSGADLFKAQLGLTSLSGLDLSGVKGLTDIEHRSPSDVGVNTLIASFRGAGGRLTEELRTFFLGAGVPQELLDALPGVVREVEYYSCFISYGQPDLEFATKLYEELKSRGVSCWLYDMDKTVGKRTWSEIGESRRGADRFVVLCSAAALVRPGVRKEIEEQIDEDPDKLVPISLEDLWTQPGFPVVRDGHDLKPFLMERNRPDFSGWDSDPSRYDEALDELLRGLRRPEIKKPQRKKG